MPNFRFYKLVLSISLLIVLISSVKVSCVEGTTVSPLKTEINIMPGTQVQKSLSVTNKNNHKTELYFNVSEFKVSDYQYDYIFNENSDITKWINFDNESIILYPNQTKIINYTLGVPVSAEPGGRYLSIFVSSDKKLDDGESILRQRLASLVYINVEGEVTRSGSLISFNNPWFITNQPIWSASLRNSGTTHYRSRYTVSVFNLFDKKVSEDKSGEALILPGTIRLITDNFNLPKWPGIYKIDYHIGLGDNPAFKKTKIVVFLPSYATAILLFVLILSIIKIKSKVRKKP